MTTDKINYKVVCDFSDSKAAYNHMLMIADAKGVKKSAAISEVLNLGIATYIHENQVSIFKAIGWSDEKIDAHLEAEDAEEIEE